MDATLLNAGRVKLLLGPSREKKERVRILMLREVGNKKLKKSI